MPSRAHVIPFVLMILCGWLGACSGADREPGPSTAASAASGTAPAAASRAVTQLERRVAELEARVNEPPELGGQMLELQIRHDRLWWAGESGNWNLAYFMVGELGEALHGIEESNPDAAELQPQRLAEVMPSIMDPALKEVMQALGKRDKNAFETAFGDLSAACTACHQLAGNPMLVIQPPKTPLLDNLRYAPAPASSGAR